jgi:hypothetical protein
VDLKRTIFWDEKPCPLVAVSGSYCLLLAVFKAQYLSMNMAAMYSSETLATIYQIDEECCLLGCGAAWVNYKPTFRRSVSPPF